VTKVFELLIYYSYIFVLFKIIENEMKKYYRINKGKYKNVEGVITNISDTYRTINGENRCYTTYKVTYDVDDKEYSFECDKMWYEKRRNIGETIDLMYDIDNPNNYHITGKHTVIVFIIPLAIYILYYFIKYLIK